VFYYFAWSVDKISNFDHGRVEEKVCLVLLSSSKRRFVLRSFPLDASLSCKRNRAKDNSSAAAAFAFGMHGKQKHTNCFSAGAVARYQSLLPHLCLVTCCRAHVNRKGCVISARSFRHTHVHSHTYTHTYTRTHPHTHTYTHAHTHVRLA
jgi:hypothetical protein